MNLNIVNETYFNKLFKWEDEIKGKVLLVDKHTMPIISMCYGQSQLLNQDILLIDLIDNYRSLDTMKHLNCIIYIKPIAESIELLSSELSHPHFNHYKLFFNNIINKNQLEKIAEFDKFEVINSIIEIFQDYMVINESLFQIPINSNNNNNSIIDESNKLVSLLLSIKKFPIIKFNNNSINCKKLSSEILYQINSNLNNNLFENLNYDIIPQLILFDRSNDPITPLLNPWTYQSMIHELIGIEKNLVQISSDEKLLVNEIDEFFSNSKSLNYGDLTENFQRKVEIFKKESNNNNLKTTNLIELKKILTRLPEFKKKSSNILKHLNIITELDNQISKRNLWEVSELQQTIVCNLDSKHAIDESMKSLLSNANVLLDDKIKLILLYSIRFKDIKSWINYLNEPSLAQLKLINNFSKTFNINYNQQQQQSNSQGGINLTKFFKNFSNSEQVDNVFLQYTPPLKFFLDNLINQFPDYKSSPLDNLNTLVPDTLDDSNVIQDIIIYFKGGVTYEESRIVDEFNKLHKKVNVIIGSDQILNSSQWLNQLYDYT